MPVGAQFGWPCDVAAPINASIAQKFFNVRSALDVGTAVELIWEDKDGDTIDPEGGPSPLAGLAGPGDGTVPAWSAFHAYCKNRHDLTEAKDPAPPLEPEEGLRMIESVVTTGKLLAARGKPAPKRGGKAKRPAVASPQKLHRAVTTWAERSKAKQAPPPELFEKPVQRAFLASLIGGAKPRMVGRSPL